jgi:hypothetical protein
MSVLKSRFSFAHISDRAGDWQRVAIQVLSITPNADSALLALTGESM